jgi:thioredoxin-related protein
MSCVQAADTTPGKITGGIEHHLPDWFKQSFLDFEEDILDAREHGRHILVFFDLNGCPYCARMLNENFHGGENAPYIRKHFDVIALNIRGAREVTWIDGVSYTEQDLASKLKYIGTPAMAFIDPENGKKVFQLSAYRTPPTLRHALEYVHDRAYQSQSLAEYIEKNQEVPVYTFRDNPFFEDVTDFANYQKPLLVIFEDRNCADCESFHSSVLSHPNVSQEMKLFRVVRLDAYSETPIIDISGKRTTPRAWAAELGIDYRPGIVMFDEGKEAARLQGRFYHFFFKEMLRFVSGKYYQRYTRFGQYLEKRQPELLEQGVNVDIGE